MKEGRKLFAMLLILLSALLAVSGIAGARFLDPSEENRNCLTCHGKRGIVKKFENGESVNAYIDAAKFQSSVHNFLKCSHCHNEFSAENHPLRKFRSTLQYQIRSSHICRSCHPDDQLMKKTVHAGLLISKEGKSPICNDCHNSHYVVRIETGSAFTSEEQYCLRCHANNLHMSFLNGEPISLKVDTSKLNTSVHNKLSCSDCHFGFSSEEHPRRNFRTERDFKIASSETCRRCHFDKYTKTMESIHYTMLSQGNIKAPVCTDCHGAHSVPRMVKEKTFIAKRCQTCHPEIYATYAQSVHGSALFNEHNQDVPVCIDCHKAHNIENPFTLDYREKIPEMCGGCHANKAIAAKYGLSTEVVDTYLSDFHGVTLKFYQMEKDVLTTPAKPIAVCTDCHGTHDISSTIGPDANAVKARLVKRCQKCHEGATTNFPASWLPHYEASFAKSPLVFIVKLIYKILIPVMLAGLILQILLHIWRYAVNR